MKKYIDRRWLKHVFDLSLNHFQSSKRDWICQRSNCKTVNFYSKKQTQRTLTWVWKVLLFFIFFTNVWSHVVCFLEAQSNTAAVSVSLLVMEIADLRTKLKKAQREASKAAKKNIDGLSSSFPTIVSLLSSNTV